MNEQNKLQLQKAKLFYLYVRFMVVRICDGWREKFDRTKSSTHLNICSFCQSHQLQNKRMSFGKFMGKKKIQQHFWYSIEIQNLYKVADTSSCVAWQRVAHKIEKKALIFFFHFLSKYSQAFHFHGEYETLHKIKIRTKVDDFLLGCIFLFVKFINVFRSCCRIDGLLLLRALEHFSFLLF